MSERFTIPPPEMFHAKEISHWWFTGPVVAFMVVLSLVLSGRAFLWL
jgi:hypothetical protein